MMEQWEVQGDDRQAADGSAREDQQGCGVKTWKDYQFFRENLSQNIPKPRDLWDVVGKTM